MHSEILFGVFTQRLRCCVTGPVFSGKVMVYYLRILTRYMGQGATEISRGSTERIFRGGEIDRAEAVVKIDKVHQGHN